MSVETWLEKTQTSVEAISNNRYLKAISKAMVMSIAPTMVGAICTLLKSIQIDSYQNFLVSSGLEQFFNLPIFLTTNIMALFVVYFVALNLVKSFEIDATIAGILGIVSFLIMTPLASFEVNERMNNFISFDWLGAKGMFVAIMIGLFVGRLYALFITRNIYIKMPESVPSFVEKSFAFLIPFIFITLLISFISWLFSLSSFGNIHTMIYGYLQVPLQSIGGSFGGVLVAYVVINLCWWFGIHGKALVFSVVAPIWSSLSLENMTATNAGEVPPHLIDLGFTTIFMEIGGAGCILGLALLFVFFAKSERYKGVGKVTIIPTIFGINEPITFGTPVVMNPLFLVPTILTPIICAVIGYSSIAIGFVPRMTGASLPTAVPAVVNAFLLASWQGVVVQVVCIAVAVLLYFPFFKVADRRALQEERETAEAELMLKKGMEVAEEETIVVN